jgi:hypothetical protein
MFTKANVQIKINVQYARTPINTKFFNFLQFSLLFCHFLYSLGINIYSRGG